MESQTANVSTSSLNSFPVVNLKTYKTAQTNEVQILNHHIKIGSELSIIDVPVTIKGVQTFIHTYYIPVIDENPHAETMVLLHGFGGSGLSFCQMMKPLSQFFNLYTIDLIGMGLSDRQNFNIENDARAVVDFFVESVEQWRIQMKLDKFVIIGHSFGGYVAGHYALRNPKHISEVFLLSPMAGTKVAPEDDLSSEEKYQAYVKKLPFKRRMLSKFIRCQTTVQKVTPGIMLNKWFIPANYFLEKAIGNRLNITEKTQVKLWKGFLKNSFNLPQSTEHHIHDLLSFPGPQAKYSLEEAIHELKEKVNVKFYIMFGDDDWMNQAGCVRVIDQKKIEGELITVRNAGHQLPFDQPIEVAQIIISKKLLL